MTKSSPLRRRIYEVIEVGRGDDKTSRIFDACIISLILLNILAFCLETVPSIEAAYGNWFHGFEIFSVIVFTGEYVLRLWTAIEVPFLSRMPPWRARLRFARRPYLIIDFLAIAPFYLGQLIGLDLRALRVLRLMRFLKLTRYSPAIHTLMRVVYNERRSLLGAGLLLLGMVLLASTGIYYIEREIQPDKFGSVPDAMWWAMATLTTVGYGDVAPVTPLGKFFGGIVMVGGLCILALPVAIISSGFAQEVGRHDFVVTWSLMSRIPLLAELDADQVANIMPLLHAHNVPQNVELIAQGSPGEAMYFIASGTVKMRGNGYERSYVTGDFFGAAAVVENDLHRGSFRTAGRCRLLKLFKEDFNRLEAANPAIGAHIRTVARKRREEQEAELDLDDPVA